MAQQCGFKEVTEIFTSNNCLACHNAQAFGSMGGGLNLDSGNVGERLLGRKTAKTDVNCGSDVIIDADNFENSLLLKLVDPHRYDEFKNSSCKRPSMPQTGAVMSEQEVDCLESWMHEVIDTQTPAVDPEPVAKDFKPATAASALTKAKYILHGGAPTAEEMAAIGGDMNNLDRVELRKLIANWQTTQAYETKMRGFLEFALQNEVGYRRTYTRQFNSIYAAAKLDAVKLDKNLGNVFIHTSFDIVKNGGDFSEVLTTRRWKVTTAVLAAMAYGDIINQTPRRRGNQQSIGPDRFSQYEHLIESDYEDWRYVTFVHSDEPAQYDKTPAFAANLRAIPDGGELKLRYPRVGFFSTPVFHDQWQTNSDNLFRVTASQTMIAALDAEFTPGDATVHLREDGIDLLHADPSTTCYQCHRHMDTMKLIFSNYQTITNRSKETVNDLQPTFSFMGVAQDMTTVEDFAQILAEHPRFPVAWVQKLCMWGNSQRCSETDPEFIRLAGLFENSKFSMRTLVQHFFSSPIFTGNRLTQTHEDIEFAISMSRSNHLCRAMDQRVKSLNESTGTQGSINMCGIRFDSFGIIPSDLFSRGEADFIQSRNIGAFEAKSIDLSCAKQVNRVFTNNKSRLIDSRATVDDIISQLVEHIMGLPNNHPRYSTVTKELADVYNIASHDQACPNNVDPGSQNPINCGYGQSKVDSLKMVWFAACTSPELISVGF